MYPYRKINDGWTYTSREMEINAKVSPKVGWTDQWTGQKLNPLKCLVELGIKLMPCLFLGVYNRAIRTY